MSVTYGAKAKESDRELAERIAREHPNYVMDRRIDGQCRGCGAGIEAIDGRMDLGWNRHIAEVAIESTICT